MKSTAISQTQKYSEDYVLAFYYASKERHLDLNKEQKKAFAENASELKKSKEKISIKPL
jgi:hypothetical protein